MKYFFKFFEKTEYVLILSIILPFLLSINISNADFFIQLSLGIMMFLSIRPFFHKPLNMRKEWKTILLSVILNYVILSGAYILLAYIILGPTHPFFIGYVLLALVPPAISIIPLCYLSRCDPNAADSALFLSFALSLIIIPSGMYIFFSKSISMYSLMKIMFFLIIVPTLVAYVLRNKHYKIYDYTKTLTNICLGLAVFLAISPNRSLFFDFSNTGLLNVYIINFLVIFGVGCLTFFITLKTSYKSKAVNFALYATQKNEGTGIAIGILLFIPIVVIPVLVALVMQLLFFIFFEKVVLPKTIAEIE